jgi:hypothetical protein
MKLYRPIAFVAALAITLLLASLPVLKLSGALGAHGVLKRAEHQLAAAISSFTSGKA